MRKLTPSYCREWTAEPHHLAVEITGRFDRTLQVWEMDDGDVTHFVLGPPEVTAWTDDGKPFQFSHRCLTIDADGDQVEWPLIETVDRTLETSVYTRLA